MKKEVKLGIRCQNHTCSRLTEASEPLRKHVKRPLKSFSELTGLHRPPVPEGVERLSGGDRGTQQVDARRLRMRMHLAAARALQQLKHIGAS